MGVQGVSGGSSGTPIHTGAGQGGAARAGGVEPRPYAWIGDAVRGGIRIATPACGLARNDMGFGMGVRRGADGERLSFPYGSSAAMTVSTPAATVNFMFLPAKVRPYTRSGSS